MISAAPAAAAGPVAETLDWAPPRILATLGVDQSRAGLVVYAEGSKATITGWLLAE